MTMDPADVDIRAMPTVLTETSDDKDALVDEDEDTNTSVVKVNRMFTVEPIALMFSFFSLPIVFILANYINARITQEVLAEGVVNVTNITNKSPCNSTEDDPVFQLESEVQSRVAYFALWQTVIYIIPGFITTLFLGPYGDKAGRKYVIVIPLIGYQLSVLCYLIVIWTGWPLEWMLVGSFLDGASGSYFSLNVGLFSYITDVTKPEDRVFRLTVLEIASFLSAVAIYAGFGYVIEAWSYLWPFLICFLGLTMVNVYALFFLPETVKKDPSAKFFSVDHLKSSVAVITRKSSTGRRWKLGILQAGFFFNCMPYFAAAGLTTIFLLNRPMCWSAAKLGVYNAVYFAIAFVASGTFSKLSKFCIPDHLAMIVVGLSCLSQAMSQSFITNDLYMYLVPLTGCVRGVLIPTSRALMSTIVDNDEQGALFAVLSGEEVIATTLGSIILNPIYAATARYWPGCVFFVGGMLYGIATLFFICYAVVGVKQSAVPTDSVKEMDKTCDASAETTEQPKESNC